MSSTDGDIEQKKPGKLKRLGRYLSKIGKKVLPAVAGIAVGTVVGPAAIPITQFITSNLLNFGISIDQSALEPAVKQLLTGASSETVQAVFEQILEKEALLNKKPIDELLEAQTAQIQEYIQLALNDSLRPVLDAIREASQFIQESPLEAIDELKKISIELKEELGHEIRNYTEDLTNKLISSINSNLDSITNNISKLDIEFGYKLDYLGKQLEKLTRQLTTSKDESGKSLTEETALALCLNQVNSEPILSRYDIRYNEELYVHRPDAERAIFQFIRAINVPGGIRSNIFVLLAGMGIGKTWLLGYIANSLIKYKRPVLFFELRNGGLNRIISYLGADTGLDAYRRIERIKNATDYPLIIILDGLDELSEPKRLDILNWVIHSKSILGNRNVAFIISCRDYDWKTHNELLTLVHTNQDCFYEFDIENGSLCLQIFDETQLNEAAERYGITSDIKRNEKIKELAKYPFITRLFGQYKKINNRSPIPDPDNLDEFMPFFYDKNESTFVNTILYRMDIKMPVLGFLGNILSCCKKDSLELDLKLVEKRNLDKNKNYPLLFSSGLFIKKFGLVEKVFMNPLYAPYLVKLAELEGIELLEEVSPETPKKGGSDSSISKMDQSIIEKIYEKRYYRNKLVKNSETEPLIQLQKKFKIPVKSFEVDRDGNIIYLDLTDYKLDEINEFLNTFKNLTKVNLPIDEITSDSLLNDLLIGGIEVELDGKKYHSGMISENIRTKIIPKAENLMNKLKTLYKNKQIDEFTNTIKELTELNDKYSLGLSNDIKNFNNKLNWLIDEKKAMKRAKNLVNKLESFYKNKNIDELTNAIKELTKLNNKYSLGFSNKIEEFNNKLNKLIEEKNAIKQAENLMNKLESFHKNKQIDEFTNTIKELTELNDKYSLGFSIYIEDFNNKLSRLIEERNAMKEAEILMNKLESFHKNKQIDEFTNAIKELTELNDKYSLGLSNRIEDFNNKLSRLIEERNAMKQKAEILMNKLETFHKNKQIDEFTNAIKELTELNNKYSLGLSNRIEDFNNKLSRLIEEKNSMKQKAENLISKLESFHKNKQIDEFTNAIKELTELNNKYSLGVSNRIEDFNNKLSRLIEEKNSMKQKAENLISKLETFHKNKQIDEFTNAIKELTELNDKYSLGVSNRIEDFNNKLSRLMEERNSMKQKAENLINKLETFHKNKQIDEFASVIKELTELNNRYSLDFSKKIRDFNNKLSRLIEERNAMKEAENLINKLETFLKNRQINEFINSINKLTELNDKYSLGFSNTIEDFNNKFTKIINKIKEIKKIRSKYGISTEEALTLKDLKKLLGRSIPEISFLYWDNFGMVIKDGKIVGLVLYEQGLTTLPDSIGTLKSLQELDLRNNKLTTLQESFGNLQSLKELYLYGNQLTTLPDSFGNLKSLQKLDLEHNKLTTLPESFGNLINLKELYLYENQLKTLPDSIGNLINLQELYLYKNQLTTLPDSFGNLQSLKELYLYGNQLTTLPESFGNLQSLKYLYLNENQLTTLPDSFVNLKSLTYLNLRNNLLTTLPESFGDLKSLQELDLRNNKLTTLPEPILKLKNLQTLNLGGNKLTTLPESFGNLQSLLPDSFGNLKSLQELDLSYNQLTTLPDSFGNLQSIKELKLYNNKLTTLPESFGNLQSLKYLYLNENQLTTLPDSFGNLQSLQKLWLYDNKLTTLPESILKLKSLQSLDLGRNKLTTLPESLCALPNLKTIWITMRLLGKQAKSVIKKCIKKGITIENW